MSASFCLAPVTLEAWRPAVGAGVIHEPAHACSCSPSPDGLLTPTHPPLPSTALKFLWRCESDSFSLEETEQLHGFRSCQMFDV